MEHILTRAQRREANLLGKDEDAGELAFRKVCELKNIDVYRRGWRGQDEEDESLREADWVPNILKFAPDFETDLSYIEVQQRSGADHIKIKAFKFKMLDKWWDDKPHPFGEAKPLLWFFFDKPNKRYTMIYHQDLKSILATRKTTKVFKGNPEDDWKRGYQLELELFNWKNL